MKGTKKARRRIGFGLGKLEVLAGFAGLVVVLGIWIESRTEIRWAFKHHVWIPQAVGATLVGLGVFAEVLITALAARQARRADLHAEERITAAKTRISELDAETERLRKENNDTALLLRYRSIGDPAAFEKAMRDFSGTKYKLEFPLNSREGGTFGNELGLALTRAGWIGDLVPTQSVLLGLGVFVFTVKGPDCNMQSKAGVALADWLAARSIATRSGLATPDAAVVSPLSKPYDLEPGSIVIRVGSRPETIEQQRDIESEYRRQKELRAVTPTNKAQ
jgi:hypothetical protein